MALTRILIVDDHALVRRSLRTLLAKFTDIEVVGEANNGEDAIEQVTTLHPDLVLMDISMPRMDGLTATQQIRALPNPPKVLVLSMYGDTSLTLRAFRVGAAGLLLKVHTLEEIMGAIRHVMEGKKVLSAELKENESLKALLASDIQNALA